MGTCTWQPHHQDLLDCVLESRLDAEQLIEALCVSAAG